MRYGVVEGEPGIFPDPVARVFRALGRMVSGRKRGSGPEPPPESEETHEPPDDRPGEPPTG